MSSYCVLTQFVPLSMLVITSLISLWIPIDAAVKIGINALLLMSVSFKAENINNGLPFSNYTKEGMEDDNLSPSGPAVPGGDGEHVQVTQIQPRANTHIRTEHHGVGCFAYH